MTITVVTRICFAKSCNKATSIHHSHCFITTNINMLYFGLHVKMNSPNLPFPFLCDQLSSDVAFLVYCPF